MSRKYGTFSCKSPSHGDGEERERWNNHDMKSDIYLTLEGLFVGVSKKYRLLSNSASHAKPDQALTVREIGLRPGCKAGTKIRFRNANLNENGTVGDIVFVVREIEHDRVKRIGHDLEIVHRISLSEDIAGTYITITGIDGRDYHLACDTIVSPRTVKIISGAGMPKSRRPSQRRDRFVSFDIDFPSILRRDTK